ncbi:hypothetical protein [Paenarthrobacter nitroguajacolicus]|uniref:hypothetical protein n=1 Tax=Paenarthrobacter nitroguajacolicus TaxID=211146 RepID=UPI00248C597B|nr:hypothetical protein [Paenarthrobacter nitroguajacolicus]MDI2036558.1 hypothetical protein [Paenarthrobacter nitroguajacolicus]
MQEKSKESLFGVRFDQAGGKRVSDWRLLVGQTVQIIRGKEIVDQGVVDAVTFDGSVLWLRQTGAIGRRMVMKERGTIVKVGVFK